VVIGRISEDRYLVQLLEWPMGEPSVQRIVSVSEMSPWLFYNDADEMDIHTNTASVRHEERNVRTDS